MVDVQSRQQALRAYSSAKEYPCGILCDARRKGSNGRRRPARPPGERRQAPADPESPRGRFRRGACSQPLASHTRYRSGRPTPGRDGSRTGHDRASTLRDHGRATFRDIRAERSAPSRTGAAPGRSGGRTAGAPPSPSVRESARRVLGGARTRLRPPVARRPPGRRRRRPGGPPREPPPRGRRPRARAGRRPVGPGRAPEPFTGPGVLRRPSAYACADRGRAYGPRASATRGR